MFKDCVKKPENKCPGKNIILCDTPTEKNYT